MKSRLNRGRKEKSYFVEEIERAKQVYIRFQDALSKAEHFSNKVKVFFAECLAQVEEMRDPITDLRLIQELNSLDNLSQGVADRVNVQIEETAYNIMMKMGSFKQQVFSRFENNGIDLALEASVVGSFDESMDRLDVIIGQFVPAEEKLAKVISLSSVTNDD